MSSKFSKELLKIAVARICSTLGWNSILAIPMEIMIDILDRHLRAICKETKINCEIAGRTQPLVSDIHLALQQLNTNLQEISEYMENIQPAKFPQQVPKYPVACDSHLNVVEFAT